MSESNLGAVSISHLTVENGGVRLHVACAGEGPPVILLHGFPESWRSWRHQIAPLVAGGFSVWIPDLRGYGSSEKPAGRKPYALEQLVGDVAAIARATGHAKVHLAGHDWGGIIAWAAASQHPELVERLVILNAPHMGVFSRKVFRGTQWLRSWYVLFFQLPWLPEWLMAAGDYRIVRRLFRDGPARWGAFTQDDIEQLVEAIALPGALTAALNYYRQNFLPSRMEAAVAARTLAPTLVIWGERDSFLGLELLDGVAEFAPKVEIHRLPAAGHWVQNEAPDEVNAALLAFLTRP